MHRDRPQTGRRPRHARRWVWAVWAVIWLMAGLPVSAQTDEERPPTLRRMVCRFDFDEREEGNFEDLPMHWDKVHTDGFPRFTRGRFDLQVGNEEPPSFHIEADGRNAAFWYRGPATAVRPNSEYLVIGHILEDRLSGARACLSAYYLDRQGLPISGTQVFSPLVGGEAGKPSWHRVRVHLPPAPTEAMTIGLTAWVVQASVWDARTRPHRHIELRDVRGGAWFDDVTVYRMPSVLLETAAPGNVFVEPDDPTLMITVADTDAVGMSAILEVRSADGQPVYQEEIAVQTEPEPSAVGLPLWGLEPGLYEATLSIEAGSETTLTRSVHFAKLSRRHYPGTGVIRHFGVSLASDDAAEPITTHAFLHALGVGSVKVPVWGQSPFADPVSAGRDGNDELLNRLVESRVALTGVLNAPPADLTERAGSFAPSLLDILSDDPAGWRRYLEAVAAPLASVFRTWQVGADGDEGVSAGANLAAALKNLRKELGPLITTVFLSAPVRAGVRLADSLPAEELTVRLDQDIHSDWIPAYLDDFREADYQWVSAFVPPAEPGAYVRRPRLTEFAKRVIQARHAGASTVYVPRLWRRRSAPTGPVTEPVEEYVIYRTIVDMLRDLRSGPRLTIAPGVETLAFKDVDTCVLVLWDPEAPVEGRVLDLQLGSARRQIDLWGRTVRLEEAEQGRRSVRVYREPVFVDGVDRWLIDFVAGASLGPDAAEISLIPRMHTLKLTNSGKRPLSGRLHLQVPETWEVKPASFGFHMPARSELEQQFEIRYGHNEPAGPKALAAVVEFESEPQLRVEIPLTVELGIRDVDVWGFALMEGDRLVLRHGITNRSDEPLDFRSFATVPGRSRQFRVIASLQPGATNTVEYHFENADALRARNVRLGLREVDGPRAHSIELVVP